MENYKVLLVDDEEEIRSGISRRIDWNALGLELVGEAENGADALEIAELLHPDIVLTDIQMPFMDGLELCALLRKKLPTAKIVVFSGFDEFEYAQKAISMNVSQYILKPINAPELNEVLATIKAELDLRQAERRDMESLRMRYAESLPVLREIFFTRLLDGRIEKNQVQVRAAEYEIALPQGMCVAALVQVTSLTQDFIKDELLLLSVRTLLEKNFTMVNENVQFLRYNDMIAIVCSLKTEKNIYNLIEQLNSMCLLAKSYLRLSLSIGVGRVQAEVNDLHFSAEQARLALDYRVLTTDSVIYLGDLEPVVGTQLTFNEEDERTLCAAVKLGTEDELCAIIDGLMPRINAAGSDLGQYQLFFIELTTCLIRLARSVDIKSEDVFGKDFTATLQLTRFSSLNDSIMWCKKCSLRLHSLMRARRNDSNWRTIEQAKLYITQNYADPNLNVEALCLYLHLSPAYFSTLFKRETDQTFINYLTDVRMNAAIEMLRQTDEKTYLISERIGYIDPNYFSYVFKKRFGMSPSKYRTEHFANK